MGRSRTYILVIGVVTSWVGCSPGELDPMQSEQIPCAVGPSGVQLQQPSGPLVVGAEFSLSPTVSEWTNSALGCAIPEPTWSVANSQIASVRWTAYWTFAVRGLAAGRTSLTATVGGQSASIQIAVEVPAPVPDFVGISAGPATTCGLTTIGEPYCWGDAQDRGLVAPDGLPWIPAGTVPFPVRQVAPSTLSSLDSRGDHGCGLAPGGLWCWGRNDLGQLGNGTAGPQDGAVLVTGSEGFRTGHAGGSHSCALNQDGAAFCWGSNQFGQLGDSTTTNRLVPVPASGEIRFRSVSAGSGSTCGISQGGALFCWGAVDNQALEGTCWSGGGGKDLGHPVRCVAVPTRMALDSAAGPDTTFVSVSLGIAEAGCVLSAAGHPFCWGRSPVQGRNEDALPAPTAVPGSPVFTMVSVGINHACGLASGGTAYCWGLSPEGALGDGASTGLTAVPVRVASSVPFTAVTAGGIHSCGITTRGKALCWGGNSRGQLGNGSDQARATPTAILGQR